MTSRYRSLRSISPVPSEKNLARPGQRARQCVDVGFARITRERGAGGGRYIEEIHDGHGAVMPGAHGHTLGIENRAEIVRVDTLERERDDCGLVGRRADDLQSRYPQQLTRRNFEQALLVR